MLDEREHLAGRQNSVVHGLGGELHVVLAVRVRVPQEVGLVLPDNLLRPVTLDLGRRDLRLWSRSFGDGHVPAHVLQRPFEASFTSTLPLSVTLKEASWGSSLNSSARSSRTLLALSLSYPASRSTLTPPRYEREASERCWNMFPLRPTE